MARPAVIRSLRRGLTLLEAVNLHNGGALRDFVEMTGLPKTTVHRLLENLCDGGYLRRDPGDDRYYLCLAVRRLSDGFQDGGWIRAAARPLLVALSREVGYPVAIATPFGAAMMLRDNTDALSPLAPNIYSRGTILPLLTSATGKVYLAFCDDVTRKTLVDVCRQSGRPEHELARHPALLSHSLAQIRRQGYAFGPGARRGQPGVETATFSVPIHCGDTLIGSLALRYLSEGASRRRIVARYLGSMRMGATRIGAAVASSATDPR